MCFSAGASFTAAIFLSLIGVMTLHEVRRRALMGVAAVPFFFGIQQAAEGMVWFTQGLDAWWIYCYLCFALFLWPLWIPFSLWLMEAHKKRKGILASFLLVGLCASIAFVYELYYHGAVATIENHHVHYQYVLPFHTTPFIMTVLYALPVIGSFFVSTNRLMHIFGALIFVTAAAATLVWNLWFTSIWCFFAAIVSMGALWIIRREQHS